MTKEELRDQLVKLAGLSRNESDPIRVYWRGVDRFDLNTLDGIAALWPEGWHWGRWGDGVWIAQRNDGKMLEASDTGDELFDRMALTIKVLESKAV